MDTNKIQKTNLTIKTSKFKNSAKNEKQELITNHKKLGYLKQSITSLVINEPSDPLRVPVSVLKKKSRSGEESQENRLFRSIHSTSSSFLGNKCDLSTVQCLSNNIVTNTIIEENFNENSLLSGSISNKSDTYKLKSKPLLVNIKRNSQLIQSSSTGNIPFKRQKRKPSISNKLKEKENMKIEINDVGTNIASKCVKSKEKKLLNHNEKICSTEEPHINQKEKARPQDSQYNSSKNAKYFKDKNENEEAPNHRQFFSPSKQSIPEIESRNSDKEAKSSKRLKKGKSEGPRRLIMKDFGHYEELIIKESKIHGRGIFTPVDIAVNTLLMEYKGEIIGKCMSNKREKLYKKNNIDSIYMFSVSEDMVIDATMIGNKARYINHSCNPNCEAIHSMIDKSIKYCSIQDIRAGEELTINYNMSQENNGERCNCGAIDCISNNIN
ncbi:hypothetical protein GINT2_000263 [Glugoides intestinalis]